MCYLFENSNFIIGYNALHVFIFTFFSILIQWNIYILFEIIYFKWKFILTNIFIVLSFFEFAWIFSINRNLYRYISNGRLDGTTDKNRVDDTNTAACKLGCLRCPLSVNRVNRDLLKHFIQGLFYQVDDTTINSLIGFVVVCVCEQNFPRIKYVGCLEKKWLIFLTCLRQKIWIRKMEILSVVS